MIRKKSNLSSEDEVDDKSTPPISKSKSNGSRN